MLTGSVYINVNTGSGNSSAASDSAGSLNINYADGTKEIVVNALSGGLTGGGTQVGTPKKIAVTSGSSQTTTINTAFALPLVATVTDTLGSPVSGVDVKFTSPSNGQSCTFPGGGNSKTLTTNSLGQASINVTANDSVGDYKVTASVVDVVSTAEFSLTNTHFVPIASYSDPIIFNYNEGFIIDLNNNGQLIGYIADSNGFPIPIYWPTTTSQRQNLHLLHSSDSDTLTKISGINDNGQIVGFEESYYTANVYIPTSPLYWPNPTAKPQYLAVPKNTFYTEAMDINNNKQIVGFALSSDNNSYIPVYWPSPTDTPIVLKTNNDNSYGVEATGITSNGQIFGSGANIWANPTALPVVLSAPNGEDNQKVFSMNSSGIIVGQSSYDQASGTHAITWASRNSTAMVLPFTSGDSINAINSATSINIDGVIVGAEKYLYSIPVGVIWKNGQAQDLNKLTSFQSTTDWIGNATLITDKGWILGSIGSPNYPGKQYILIPK